jgi:hypothetical protein
VCLNVEQVNLFAYFFVSIAIAASAREEHSNRHVSHPDKNKKNKFCSQHEAREGVKERANMNEVKFRRVV